MEPRAPVTSPKPLWAPATSGSPQQLCPSPEGGTVPCPEGLASRSGLERPWASASSPTQPSLPPACCTHRAPKSNCSGAAW